MPSTIKELQDAMRQYLDAGLKAEEAIQRLAAQFPDAKESDARIAAAALAEEKELEADELESEARAMKAVGRLVKRAEEESGRPMVTGEALTYLAERGDADAQAYLDQMKTPEGQAFERDFEAAVQWHPDWTKDGRGYRCKCGSEVPTPEKLVEAFRRSRP